MELARLSLSLPMRCFLKLCRDTGLIDDTFSAVDADLIFAKAHWLGFGQ